MVRITKRVPSGTVTPEDAGGAAATVSAVATPLLKKMAKTWSSGNASIPLPVLNMTMPLLLPIKSPSRRDPSASSSVSANDDPLIRTAIAATSTIPDFFIRYSFGSCFG